MAIHAPITGAPVRATMFYPARTVRVRRLIAALSPDEIDAAIEVLISRLDALAGDPDFETLGSEDDFICHPADGPGCPVADTDHCDAHDDNPYRLFGDGAAGDPDDAEDEGDREGMTDTSRVLPLYRIDQSRGPINEAEAYLAWQDRRSLH